MPAVLDASVAISWIFADVAADSDETLEYVRKFGALVPPLWFLEVASIILQAQKAGKILIYDTAGRLEMISALPISVDQNMAARAWDEIMDLARTEHLSVYAATYLDLAIRRSLPLFTHDDTLLAAAERRHVLHTLNWPLNIPSADGDIIQKPNRAKLRRRQKARRLINKINGF
jgi:predicted nucleic acid-binding protein